MNNLESNNKNIKSFNKRLDDDNISFGEIIVLLARHIKVIIITPFICCTLAIIYVLFIAKPVYTSDSKIMSSTGSSSTGIQASGLAAQFGINIPMGQPDQQWVYSEIIKSRALAGIILMRKFDTKEFGPQKSLLQILTYGNNKPEFGFDTLKITASDALLGMIDVSESKRTGIFTIKTHASEPQLATEINQAIIDELDTHQRKYIKRKTSKTRKFIDERILETEKELRLSEEALKSFMDRNRRIENSPGLLLEKQRLTREVTVMTGVFTSLKQQLETSKIDEVKESNYVIVLDPPKQPLQRSKPNKRLTVILVGLISIGLGVVISFLFEYIINGNIVENENLILAKSLFIKNLSGFIPGIFKKN